MDVPLALCLKNCVMGRPGIVQLEEGGSKGECVQDPGRGFLAVRLLAPSDPSRGPQGQNWFCLFVFFCSHSLTDVQCHFSGAM